MEEEGKQADVALQQQQAEEECTCGHFHDTGKSHKQASVSSSRMDSSFVHLPAHLSQAATEDGVKSRVPISFATSPSSFDAYQHLQELTRAAQNGGDGVRLCADCIHRVEVALDADTERLENECLMYEQSARQEEERLERLEKALGTAVSNNLNASAMMDSFHGSQPNTPNSNLQTAEQAYREEIQALEEDCRQQEAELGHLKALRLEQRNLAQELAETEYELETQKNALELEARAFNNDQQQLYNLLQEIETEVDKLSSDISLPSILLDLQVDKERGLRYPLINELRLAYRPKGDIKWNEIQVAWSLAAQLLLVIGTLFHYPSEQWKIVPLSHCAKLIFFSSNEEAKQTEGGEGGEDRQRRAVVYHLGHPKTNGAKAIRAWNTLLRQVIQHVSHKTQEEYQKGDMVAPFPKLPFGISPDTIGTIDLTQLNENDDAGWSRAIHFMASDLLWLSECAALYTSQQVLWTSAVLQAFQA